MYSAIAIKFAFGVNTPLMHIRANIMVIYFEKTQYIATRVQNTYFIR